MSAKEIVGQAYRIACLCGGLVLMCGACGGDDSNGGSGGSGAAGGGGGAGGGGSALCQDDVSGQAAPVTIRIRNEGMTDLEVPSFCVSPWLLTSTSGAHAPGGPADLHCGDAPPECAADCTDVPLNPLAPLAEVSFEWDGVLLEEVDAAAEGCPAIQAGNFCPTTCKRRVDAAPGVYTVTAILYEAGEPLEPKSVMLDYPMDTQAVVTFP